MFDEDYASKKVLHGRMIDMEWLEEDIGWPYITNIREFGWHYYLNLKKRVHEDLVRIFTRMEPLSTKEKMTRTQSIMIIHSLYLFWGIIMSLLLHYFKKS